MVDHSGWVLVLVSRIAYRVLRKIEIKRCRGVLHTPLILYSVQRLANRNTVISNGFIISELAGQACLSIRLNTNDYSLTTK